MAIAKGRDRGEGRRCIPSGFRGDGFGREFLQALLFLLFFLRQISLAFLELVIWLGQVDSFERRNGRSDNEVEIEIDQ